jgi:hypothetical protein
MILNFIEDYKWVIIIVILAFFMAYFMGFTISTIVDYRLRDALMNLKMPRPKVIIAANKEGFINPPSSRSERVSEEEKGKELENLPKNREVNSETNGSIKLESKVKGCKSRDETMAYNKNYERATEKLYTEQSPFMAANAEDIEAAFMDFET